MPQNSNLNTDQFKNSTAVGCSSCGTGNYKANSSRSSDLVCTDSSCGNEINHRDLQPEAGESFKMKGGIMHVAGGE